jgi:hypothetical protein
MVTFFGRRAGRWFGRFSIGLAMAALPALAPVAANAAEAHQAGVLDSCQGQVCLFTDDTLLGFVDVSPRLVGQWQQADGWETQTVYAANGLADNAVYFSYASGATSCIQPQREASTDFSDSGYGAVEWFLVSSSGNCYPNGQIQ